ncbi:dephospho-CoA kinase [candidate division NPL-UPA2 bacterium Unc8]|uniref:Dephospho-CoA kinase n=1 Tax=candidate division NPL-UPA2 bacterium Unc8 TaxID=1980939 RepID=A0A399FVT8_UNCN2|nr:Dephospho-CoA kinase [Bacillota bacterium]RII00545.1 MAG: dephospho-CoA kinase [candidate division NPL-UPA2 bacterium Unc8]
MKRTIIVGVTGGIATGKSTIAEMLGRLGAKVIDVDRVAHRFLKRGTIAWRKVVDEFGDEILNKNLVINRKRLGKIIFTNKDKQKKLEKIIHPLVIEAVREKISRETNQKQVVIVIDAPLLIESGLVSLMDKLIVVNAPGHIQRKRLVKRGLTQVEIKKRIDSQLPLAMKVKLADYIVENNGNLTWARKQVGKIWNEI